MLTLNVRASTPVNRRDDIAAQLWVQYIVNYAYEDPAALAIILGR